MDNNKISMKEYFDNNELLEVSYIPFDIKLQIISIIIQTLVSDYGHINRSIIRRVSIETIIESLTNIDMKLDCDNGLKGFDYMYYIKNGFMHLISNFEDQYDEFQKILEEQIADYNDGKFKVVMN